MALNVMLFFFVQGALDKHIQKHKECGLEEVYVKEKATNEVCLYCFIIEHNFEDERKKTM